MANNLKKGDKVLLECGRAGVVQSVKSISKGKGILKRIFAIANVRIPVEHGFYDEDIEFRYLTRGKHK